MDLHLDTVMKDGIAIIRVEAAAIPAESGGMFMHRMSTALHEVNQAVVDLSGVLGMSSAVAYAMVRLLADREAGFGRRFAVAAPPAAVNRLFDLLDLTRAIPVFGYTEDALIALQAANLVSAAQTARSAAPSVGAAA